MINHHYIFDNIILISVTLCIPPKNKISRFSFPNLILECKRTFYLTSVNFSFIKHILTKFDQIVSYVQNLYYMLIFYIIYELTEISKKINVKVALP